MRLNISRVAHVLGGFVLIAGVIVSPHRAQANVVGPDAQNFNPTTDGLDFVTVQSSETLKPGIFNLGLFLNYAVNSLPYFDTNQSKTRFNDTLLGLDLNAGVGLTSFWDVGISLPQILRQTVEDTNGARGEFAATGTTEIRVNSKFRLFGDDSHGLALVLSGNFNQIQNNPYSGSGGGPTFNAEAAADTTLGRVAVGGNIGYRFRSPGSKIVGSIANPLGNQFIFSGAVSYLTSFSTKIIGEVFASLPAQDTNENDRRSLSSAEALLGLKWDVTTNLALHAGAGTELSQGLASPDYRVYTGLNYTFGPVFHSLIPPATKRPVVASGRVTEETVDEELLQQLTTEQTSTGPVERFRTQSILFEFDSDRMVGNYARVLEELAKFLRGGFKELIVEGHTDSIGSDAYNLKLSQRRSNAIKRYLVQKYQFSPKSITPIGYGESRPIADNGNYQGRQLNRRVEFKLRR
jgi:outer membrane protein OmpA-like peptidoglycan-associated protein